LPVSEICSIFAQPITIMLQRINMKKLLIPFVLMTIVLLLDACSSAKQVAYFQNIDSTSLTASKGLYDARIMPKDLLTITVVTSDPSTSKPFNLSIQNTLGTDGRLGSTTGSLLQYLVNNDGDIDFPVVGTVHVAGLTKDQCEDLIKSKVKPYLAESENPVVTVSMSSYRVTVAGEVTSPKVVPVSTEKMSVLEALAQAGDLTIYGRRDNVLLIRENADGQKEAHRLNLNDANIINSPYYYVQQNDYIYVEPNSVKAKNSAIGQSTTLWFSFVSILTSVAALVVNIVRN
jgi:polysaccharide export outer membrane protein